MIVPERRGATLACQFPEGRLRTVFAKLKGGVVGGLGSRAGHALHAAGLVLTAQCVNSRRRRPAFAVNTDNALHRAPAAGGIVGMGNVMFVAHFITFSVTLRKPPTNLIGTQRKIVMNSLAETDLARHQGNKWRFSGTVIRTSGSEHI